MTSAVPGVLADPVGVVVGLIIIIEPALDSALAGEVVRSVAAGRAKRRRLAQALAGRPSLLTDGRSPAPRVAGDLLIALRKAGATAISPPCCADCGKHLRSLQRRGEDWYCPRCAARPEPCFSCGQKRVVASRDRQQQPRCGRCPDRDSRDPLAVLTQVITAVDPSLPAETITAAARRVFSRPAHLQRLARAVEDTPGLLTGGGADAPLAGVLRLIDQLCEAGAQQITRPACPRCCRVVRLCRRRDRQWICRNCLARARATQCARCGVIREPAARDEQGRPLCPYCLITDPANLEACIVCGRRRPVAVRAADGAICPNCRPRQILSCGICGHTARCEISRATGKPWCDRCQQWWAPCSRCRNVAPVRGGTRESPLCARCLNPDPAFWGRCPACETTWQLSSRPCQRCVLSQKVRDVLSHQPGDVRSGLVPLQEALNGVDRPDTALDWISRPRVRQILAAISGDCRALTHDILDELPAGKTLAHLRAVLVATGALPERDEHLTCIEQWITRTVGERADPGERELLDRYAVWHLLRRLRQRNRGSPATHNQIVGVRQHVRGAIVLLDWLTARGLTLATCRQDDLDTWLAGDDATHRREAGHFARWASSQKLTSLDFPAIKWGGPTRVLDAETRWEQARWLLHDDALRPEDRVAGLLVLLYAQWPSAVSRLTLSHVAASAGDVRLRLGREPVVLPEPLAGLVLALAATRCGHAALGDQGTSPWLFPGGQPGRPLSACQLAERLRQLGIHPGQARSTALFQLATELPAAVLARMLGIHITVAVAWQRASSGDWTSYAAQIARRDNQPDIRPTAREP